jgi:hypothetical protein
VSTLLVIAFSFLRPHGYAIGILDLVLIHGGDGRPCPYISDAFIMSSRPLGEI